MLRMFPCAIVADGPIMRLAPMVVYDHPERLERKAIVQEMRLRLTFVHGAALRWISHLDLVRLWERALRRAGMPVAYTQGFNPQIRLQFAAALPTGCYGRAEVADLWLERPVPLDEFAARVRAQLPPGIELTRVEEVDAHSPSLQAQLRAADWRVAVEAPTLSVEQLAARVATLLAADEVPHARRRREGETPHPYDLRPLIEALWVEGAEPDGWLVLRMRLRAEPGATGRPDAVLDVLGLGDRPQRSERLALYFLN